LQHAHVSHQRCDMRTRTRALLVAAVTAMVALVSLQAPVLSSSAPGALIRAEPRIGLVALSLPSASVSPTAPMPRGSHAVTGLFAYNIGRVLPNVTDAHPCELSTALRKAFAVSAPSCTSTCQVRQPVDAFVNDFHFTFSPRRPFGIAEALYELARAAAMKRNVTLSLMGDSMAREAFYHFVCELARTQNVRAVRVLNVKNRYSARLADFVLKDEVRLRIYYIETRLPFNSAFVRSWCADSDVFVFNWAMHFPYHSVNYSTEMTNTMNTLLQCKRDNGTVLAYLGTNAPHYPRGDGFYNASVEGRMTVNASNAYPCGVPPKYAHAPHLGDQWFLRFAREVAPYVDAEIVHPPWARAGESLTCSRALPAIYYLPHYELSFPLHAFNYGASRGSRSQVPDCLHLQYHPVFYAGVADALFHAVRESRFCRDAVPLSRRFAIGWSNASLDGMRANFRVVDAPVVVGVGDLQREGVARLFS